MQGIIIIGEHFLYYFLIYANYARAEELFLYNILHEILSSNCVFPQLE
jgi:hypothetical protein